MNKVLKKTAVIISLLFFHTVILQAELKVPGEIKFDNEVYVKVFQSGDGIKTNRVTEYLREGESLENFEKMISVWEYPQVKDMNEFADNLIRIHQSGYPSMPRSLTKKKDSSEALIKFIVSDGNASEYNLFRLMVREGHLVTYQFSYRDYSKAESAENKKWIKNTEAKESVWIKAVEGLNYIK